jgi:hypothetical protein
MVLYSFSKISEEVTCNRKRNFLKYKNILADKQFECRITTQNKAFFISKEEFLPALSNEMHIAAISRHLAKAFHCLNNESQKVYLQSWTTVYIIPSRQKKKVEIHQLSQSY